MARRYETVFILTPVLSEEQTKEAIEKYRKFLTKEGASIIHEESWGLRKLAYPIQKKTTGFYHLVEFEAEGNLIDIIEVELKRDERVIRFLTMKMEKHAITYAEKRRRLAKEEKVENKEKKKEEVTS